MRGKLSDQDLTNYALNELDARERLYVESMLAVSVECRDDVYQMIDVAQMLEEGFERETIMQTAALTPQQRQHLLAPPKQSNRILSFVNKAAATVALAACVAFALVGTQFLSNEPSVPSVAKMQSQMTEIVSTVSTVVSPKEKVDISSLVNLQTLADDYSSTWIQTASEALPQPPAVVCTPPSWLDSSDLPELR